jgi:cell division inhibitor SulA/protein ImuA
MPQTALDTVLNHPAIWRGGSCARVATPSVPTGYAELDAVLPGGGWPTAVLTEIYAERPGIGELQIIMPALAQLTQAGRWLALVAPPYIPYAPALAIHGINLARLMVIRASKEDRLWACGQALCTAGCGAILVWIDDVPGHALRRLQLAVEGRDAMAMLFRPGHRIAPSPAALKIHVGKKQDQTMVRVLKRRGAGIPAPVALDLCGPDTAGMTVRHRLFERRQEITVAT